MLEILGRDCLKDVVDELEIEDADRRSVESMRAAVSRSRRAKPELLADYLYEQDAKEVCEVLGVSSKGRRKVLLQRLLDWPDGPVSDGTERGTALQDRAEAAATNREGLEPVGKKKRAKKSGGNGANLGFEVKLWLAADKLRNNLDAAEYKHVVLGLIFLKYISDAFADQHSRLVAQQAEGADPEDPDEYRAVNVFWVPQEARWEFLQSNAKQPSIGKLVDEAMDAIERDNPSLKGVLPKQYGRPALDKQRLGELIDLIGTIGLGDKENRSKDILGRVYEYFLGQFASAEGKKGGQFYTPRCVVRVLVEMLSPYKGRVFDPCCGSGGMFVQSEKFVEEHGGRIGDIAIYGQESNPTTRRLCKMNLAIRGIDGDIGKEHADSFRRDLHKDLKADFVLANPPFNDSDWGGDKLQEDVRWKYGIPPKGNANFAWVQHFVHHLAPKGRAGFVLANGSMSSNQSGEKLPSPASGRGGGGEAGHEADCR